MTLDFYEFLNQKSSDISRYDISVLKKRPKNTSKKKRAIRDHNFGYNSHFCDKFLFMNCSPSKSGGIAHWSDIGMLKCLIFVYIF